MRGLNAEEAQVFVNALESVNKVLAILASKPEVDIMNDEVLTAQEVGEMLKVSKQTVNRLAFIGDLPYRNIGEPDAKQEYRRFLKSEVLKYMQGTISNEQNISAAQ